MALLYQDGNLLANFFEKYPQILENCIAVSKKINSDIGSNLVSTNEVSFDLILPFLFPQIEIPEAKKISYNLQVHREIVDLYNNGNSEVRNLTNLLIKSNASIPFTFEEYQKINKSKRIFLNNNLTNSYLISTERVYYRFSTNNKILKDAENRVKKFSAFLLFDDDIFDLEKDIEYNKNTILIDYLNQNSLIENAIGEILKLIEDGTDIFDTFTNIFKLTYQTNSLLSKIN